MIKKNTLLYITLLIMASCKQAPQKIDFKKHFLLKNEITINETKNLSLSGIRDPRILKDSIYIPSYANNNIYVCDIKGNLKNMINKDDDLMLRMPYQIDVYKDKIYINDRGNHQLKITDLNYKELSTIKIQGQVDQFFLIQDKNDDINIIAQGVQQDQMEIVLFKKFDSSNKEVAAFGASSKETKIFSWKSCLDSANNVYCINTIEKKINAYSKDGKYLKKIELNSPTLETLLDGKELDDKTATEVVSYLKDKSYTSIKNINCYKNYFFVQYENSKPKGTKYVLDIFNSDGDAVFSGITMDDLILKIEGKTMTTLRNEAQKTTADQFGKIILKQYQIEL